MSPIIPPYPTPTPDSIAKRLPPRIARWVNQLVAAYLCYGIDPFILAGLLDRESLGGDALVPAGPAGKGDNGHGHGLGQIDDRAHMRFLYATFNDAFPCWADPTFNVMYAARLLRKNLDVFSGDYGPALAAYNAGPNAVHAQIAGLPPDASADAKRKAADRCTTGGDYATDILARRDRFLTTDPTAVPT